MKWIEGYEGLYKVSSEGTVCSFQNGKIRILKPRNSGGYLQVTLCKDGEVKSFLVHRLVALAYIENPENKPQINHVDGDKKNNSVENLEWTTAGENIRHSVSTGLQTNTHHNKITLQFSLDGEFIKEYPSAEAACRELGLRYNALSCCLGGYNKTAFGFKWKYKEG